MAKPTDGKRAGAGQAAPILRAILKEWPEGAYFKDRQSRFTLANARVAALMGAPDAPSLIGKTDFDFYPPSTANALFEAEQRLMRTPGEVIARAERLETSTGKHVRVWTTKIRVCDEDGQVIGLFGLGSDITEVMESNAAARAQATTDHLMDGVVTIDEGGTIESVNPMVTRIFGYAEHELIGRNISMLMGEDDRRRHDGYIQRYLRTGVSKILGLGPREVEGFHKNGQPIPLELTIGEMRFAGARRFVGSLRDVSLRKRMEAELQQAQRMESLGTLTGNVSHEFNNVLMSILANLDFLEGFCGENPEARALVASMTRAAERGASLTGQLLAFSRRQVLRPEAINVNAFIEDATRLLERMVGVRKKIVLALSPELWPTKIDTQQLETAIVNLVINAADAMVDRGTITIETDNVSVGDKRFGSHESIEPGAYVRISVSDTGQGMPPEVAKQALEPFFTTKPVGQGTGLGLSMVYGFAKQSGGNLSIYSEQGHGTCVRLYLPRHTGAAIEPAQYLRASDDPATITGAILIVEDDDEVRAALVHALRDMGLTVHEAASADDALAAIEGGLQIDVLLSDVVMPGKLDGLQLLRVVRKRRPGLICILSSGYSEAFNGMASDLDEIGAAWIAKPYHPQDLATLLQKLLRS